jgi:hypothetical protein
MARVPATLVSHTPVWRFGPAAALLMAAIGLLALANVGGVFD